MSSRLGWHTYYLLCGCDLYWVYRGWSWSASGVKGIFSGFFLLWQKKILLWIYTFQAILRPFHPYNFFFQNFEIFRKSHLKFLKNCN
jgi:hypothetical protein